MRAGFLFDLERCTGCDACALACTIENDLAPGISWRQVSTFNEARHPAAPYYHLSIACNHCAEAPCMESCPALAYRRDEITGAVTLDADSCIGCGYCRWTCPFDAPRFDPATGVMTKCTSCDHRLADGRDPACVTACPTTALGYGDLETDGTVDHVHGFPRDAVGPGIAFFPLRRPAGASRPVEQGPGPPAPSGEGPSRSPIGLATEWPLAVFTLLTAGLVGWFAAARTAGVAVHAPAFLAAAAVGGGISTTHLGRPLRAWRAMLNLRGSWLSREIVSFAVFVVLALCATVLAPGSVALGWLATIAGFVCLFSADRVYDVARRKERPRIHSADTLLTGAFVWAFLAGEPGGVVAIGALKLGLYVVRHVRRPASPLPSWLTGLRLILGFVAPAVLWPLAAWHGPAWSLVSIAAGEAIDRSEFYAELEIPTPRTQMAADLGDLLPQE